ncbi:fimbrillin family protein [Sphingobacterium siyangense]|uniref:fimbrillin family protein n=1 Tax=Sphingobacterium siyangense TaxID=459529 RepID=UPI00200CADE2|nr:fimbrillin family protein [Sphingobacterium siyangense]UQA73948.1 fimbrillin family protein [Sphingobacterium siyangense]
MISQFRTTNGWKTLAFSALICGSLFACKESKDSVAQSGKANVSIHLLGVENPVVTTKKASNGSSSIASNQTIVVPLTKTSSFEATLTNESSATSGNLLRASSGNRAAVTEERTPLGNNVKYKIVVYNSSGDYVTEKTYTNTVDNTSDITLDAGQAYTFVAYSVNSTSTVPAVTAQTDLTTASLDNISADLMYFKKDLTVQAGDNNLDVVLKHQYSEVTTNLSMATEMTGAITNLAATTINPTHPSANLKLVDGTITYNGSTATTNVVFPILGAAGLRNVSSTPTVLIHPSATNGVFNFGSITIDGETKNNVSVAGLSIVPGQRYNLNLNFKTCTQEVTGGANLNWNYPAGGAGGTSGAVVDGVVVPNGQNITRTLTAPGADYGFVFDIQQLDNSFNMEVNGVKLATQEIQFEAGISTSPKNVAFADGSNYGGANTEPAGGNIVQIYNLNGTASNPILRVVISRTGEVSLYGSKLSGGPLYPLVLTAGSFNTVPWSPSSNTVVITQQVMGKTTMIGAGSGRKKIACP